MHIINRLTVRSVLGLCGAGFYSIYSRQAKCAQDPVEYSHISTINRFQTQEIAKGITDQGSLPIDLAKKLVWQSSSSDVELSTEDKFGKMLIISGSGGVIKYGNRGILPSADISPQDLLVHQREIPKESLGVIKTRNQTPFSIESHDPSQFVAIPISQLQQVMPYDREEMQKMVTFEILAHIPENVALTLSDKIRKTVLENPKRENFFEETTLVVDKPNPHLKHSNTFMVFEEEDPAIVGSTTNSHFHPSDRILYIITTDKNSGVNVNLCGIEENPNNRKDCEFIIDFPKNSLSILRFKEQAHHRFFGDFVCVSCHPTEAKNIIVAVQSGTLPKGFLESATIFSKTDESSVWNSYNKDISQRREVTRLVEQAKSESKQNIER